MKIATPGPMDPQQLMAQLQQMLPHYTYRMRTKTLMVVEKSSAIGATGSHVSRKASRRARPRGVPPGSQVVTTSTPRDFNS